MPHVLNTDLDAFARQFLMGLPGDYELPPLFGHSGKVEEVLPPTPADMLKRLGERACRRIIFPALKAETRDGYLRIIAKNFRVFRDLTRAASTIIENFAPEDAEVPEEDDLEEDLRATAQSIAGELAAEEVRFSIATLDRALRLRSKLAADQPPRDAERDRELARIFSAHVLLHQLGILALTAVGTGAPATEAAITASFELLRGGALRAFAAVREAIALRTPDPDIGEIAPFDAEDALLAGL